MDFALSEAQRAWQDASIRFAREELAVTQAYLSQLESGTRTLNKPCPLWKLLEHIEREAQQRSTPR